MAIDQKEAVFTNTLILHGARQGDPLTRTFALQHAVELDKRENSHDLGRRVLRCVLAFSLNDYFVRGGIEIPAEDATGHGISTNRVYNPDNLVVIKSAMEAFGLQESAGICIGEPDPTDSEAGYLVAVASFDFSVPGVPYLKAATDVIAWPRSSTLFA